MSKPNTLSIFECKFALSYFKREFKGMNQEQKRSGYGKQVYSNIRYLGRALKENHEDLRALRSSPEAGRYELLERYLKRLKE